MLGDRSVQKLPSLLHFAQDHFGTLQKMRAGLGQFQAPSSALQQAAAQVGFQRSHGVTDRTLRQVQLLRCLRKALAANNGHKRQQLPAIDRSSHGSRFDSQ